MRKNRILHALELLNTSFSSFKVERKFILGSLLHGDVINRRLKDSAKVGLCWSKITKLASTYHIVPQLYEKIKQLALQEMIPDCHLQSLQKTYLNTTEYNKIALDDLNLIYDAFSKSGIEFIALKGAALLLTHCQAFGSRYMSDIDLLVKSDDLVHADAVFSDLKFSKLSVTGYDYGGSKKIVPRKHHHLPPKRSPRGTIFELHDQLPGFSVEGLWQRSHLVERYGIKARIPADVDLLGIACRHALENHKREPRRFVRHAADIDLMLHTGVFDIELLRKLYDASDSLAVSRSLAMVQAVRDYSEYGLARQPTLEAEILFSKAEDLWKAYHTLQDYFEKTRSYSSGDILRMLFPSRTFMRERYKIDKNFMLPFWYLRRLTSVVFPVQQESNIVWEVPSASTGSIFLNKN
jgi:hypothetical protein